MQVVTPTPFQELWADPRYVDAVCPELVYREIGVWDTAVPYPTGSYVFWPAPVDDDYSATVVYRAIQDIPAGAAPPPTASWGRDDEAKAEQLKILLAISEASWVLWSLTNGRFHGVQCWEEDYRLSGCKLRLRRGPVTSIGSISTVHNCGADVQPYTEWCREAANVVSFCCHHPSTYGNAFLPDGYGLISCGCDRNRVRVSYEIANNLPPGTNGMVAFLACERAKAQAGKACSLPDRVTTVTRQGVSWTILDPQDFLTKGLLGVGRLDQWISVARRSISGEFIDPTAGIRVFSKQQDCATTGVQTYYGPTPPDDPNVLWIDTSEE